MNPLWATAFLFAGCCSDVIFLELLVTNDPGSGNIITFTRFLFIALEGLLFTIQLGKRKPIVPIRKYAMLVIFVFITSVLNNLVLNFNISMPLHMIFRSGSLIASMLLGILILNRRYSMSKYVSVIMISLGVGTCTFESGKYIKHPDEPVSEHGVYDLFIWTVGVLLMTLSLFLSARMGIYQESLALEYGKNPKEALFYSHALPLPGFLILSKDIYNRAVRFNQSEPMMVPAIGVTLPCMWVYLFANVVTNYVCSTSAFMLSAECSSLTVTLAVTLRKFVSLMLSIMYFNNPFTTLHWIGASLVFMGTLIFTEVFSIPTFLRPYPTKSSLNKKLKSGKMQ